MLKNNCQVEEVDYMTGAHSPQTWHFPLLLLLLTSVTVPCDLMHARMVSRVPFFATPGTVVCQASLCMGFPRQEYWNGLPFSPSGDLPNPGIQLVSPALAGWFFTPEPPGKPVALPSTNQRTDQELITYPTPPSPYLAFEDAFLKPLKESQGFFEHKSCVLLRWPCDKLFSVPNSSILVCLASLFIRLRNLSSVTRVVPEFLACMTKVRSGICAMTEFYNLLNFQHCGPLYSLPGRINTFQTTRFVCMLSKSLQWCTTLCDPMDCSLPSSSVHEILQARILEWVFLLQKIFPIWGSNLHLLYLLLWQASSLPLILS